MARKQVAALVEAPATVVNLSADQERAIAALVEGKPLADVAVAAGTSVAVVIDWQQHSAHFVAALNARRQAEYDQAEARIRALRAKAIGIVEAMLDGPGDGRLKLGAAALVLRAGSEPARPSGLTTPQAVQDAWDDAAAQAARDRRMRELLDSVGV